MVKPVFSDCCGCFSLINGTILFGWLSLVSSFHSVVVIGHRLFFGLNNTLVNFPPNLPELELVVLKTYQTEILVFLIVSGIVWVPLSALLIFGAKKSKEKLLLPWLVATLFSVVVSGICTLIYYSFSVQIAAIMTAYLVFYVYMWLCIYSLYHTIVKNNHAIESDVIDA